MRHYLTAALLFVTTLVVAPFDAGAAQVVLTWQDNSNNELGFRVERAIASGAFLQLAEVGEDVERYVDSAAISGSSLSYRVRAYNGQGNSAYSNTVFITIPPTGTAPSAPSNAAGETAGLLINVSNRGLVTTGDDTMIPGFVISGGPLNVLIRAVGPTIGGAPWNVPGVCADPAFTVRNQATGVIVATNDNWSGSAVSAAALSVGAFALPVGSKDAATLVTLPPGQYTVVILPVGTATGVALAEVYAVP